MATYLITGANRGIGFEMTRLLLERGDKVIAVDNMNEYYDVRLPIGYLGDEEPTP